MKMLTPSGPWVPPYIPNACTLCVRRLLPWRRAAKLVNQSRSPSVALAGHVANRHESINLQAMWCGVQFPVSSEFLRCVWWTKTFKIICVAASACVASFLPVASKQLFIETCATCVAMDDRNKPIDAILASLYGNMSPSEGPLLSEDEEDMVDASGGSHIYGEITPAGVDQLLGWIGRRLCNLGFTQLPCLGGSCDKFHDWTFVDLGSGVGRMVLHVAMRWGASRSCGVELSQSRHAVATSVASLAAEQGLVSSQRVEFVCCDLLRAQPHLRGNNVGVYCASLLFDDEVMHKLASMLDSHTNVRWVASLRELPSQSMSDLRLDTVLRLPMSWDDEATTEVYVYIRRIA